MSNIDKANDLKLAEQVQKAYVDGLCEDKSLCRPMVVNNGECNQIDLNKDQCEAVNDVLVSDEFVKDGYSHTSLSMVTKEERSVLLKAGFSKLFIEGLMGNDGKALRRKRIAKIINEWPDIKDGSAMSQSLKLHLFELARYGKDALPVTRLICDCFEHVSVGDKIFIAESMISIDPNEAANLFCKLIAVDSSVWYDGESAARIRDGFIVTGVAHGYLDSLIDGFDKLSYKMKRTVFKIIESIDGAAKKHISFLLAEYSYMHTDIKPILLGSGIDMVAAILEHIRNVEYFTNEVEDAISLFGKDAVPTLIHYLEDTDQMVVSAAMISLGKLGGNAKDAIPALVKMSENDPSPKIRKEAGQAIVHIYEKIW